MSRWLDRIGDGATYETLEMESNETIKQAVMAGLGVAFLSLHTVMDELATGRLVQMAAPGLPIDRHWFLVRPVQGYRRTLAEQLWQEIIGLDGCFLPGVIDAGRAG